MTNEEWERFDPDLRKEKDDPVIVQDWSEAMAYAAWLGGSLPTKAQWELAAKKPEVRQDWEVWEWCRGWYEDLITYGIASSGSRSLQRHQRAVVNIDEKDGRVQIGNPRASKEFQSLLPVDLAISFRVVWPINRPEDAR